MSSVEFIEKFAAECGAKQVGVIVHGGGINHRAFAEEEEVLHGLIAVEMDGHTRLYRVEKK